MVTVITRTIGPSGRDYASFTLAEADVANIGTSADLVANDEAIVFEADAATYSESVTFQSTLTTDATRNVTYKAASGAEHGGVMGSGVVIQQVGNNQCFYLRDSHLVFDGLFFEVTTAKSCIRDAIATGTSFTARNILFRYPSNTGYPFWHERDGGIIENCAGEGAYHFVICTAASGSFAIRNCTNIDGVNASINFTAGTGAKSVDVVNFLDLSTNSWTVSCSYSGSNNFGGATNPFPAALQGSPYPITATTSLSPGAGDWAIYEAATGRLYDVPDNDVWGQGVGPSSNPNVPTTDIVRALRSGSTANPGAFEAPAVFTTNQSVAPNGRLEADRISHIYPYTYIAQSKTSALSGGETVSYHWYFKVDSTLAAGAGETITFSIKDSGGTVVEEINWAVAYDDATPTVALGSTTTAGSGYTTDALEYVAISNDWVRCSITLTDFGSTGQDVEVTHTSLTSAASAGTIYDVTLWGSEITTIDRTPTATDLRPISGGIVDYDAYPAEHRSLFASYEDAGDNWYKVTMNLTEPN